ncbi:MAG: hypothetical protein JNK65_08505, partial [Deltaproteobacteria bacterium]|nr:hypothetical protein [Deltaproteobacteria bacterium]
SPSIQKMPFVFKSSDSPQSNQRSVLISKNAPSNVSVDISKNRNAVEGHNDLSRTSADLKATFSQSQTLNSQQSQMIRQAVTTFLSKQLGVSTEQLHPMISQLHFDHMSTSQKEILIQFFKIVVAAQETHFQLPQSIFQGMIQSIQWPIMQGLHEMFAPFLRLFFGPMNLFQPQQTQLNLFPTRLMEELGALMSTRTRRERRKNKKRPLKTEKVTGKTSSSLVDILHEEAEDEDSIFHNIDAWLNPSSRSDATSFMWQ